MLHSETAAAPLAQQLRRIVNVGARVDLVCSHGHRLSGLMTRRFTYPDGQQGAEVELDTGGAVFVPILELVPEGVTV